MTNGDTNFIFGLLKGLAALVLFWSWLDCWFALRATRKHLAAIEARLAPVAPAAEEKAAENADRK